MFKNISVRIGLISVVVSILILILIPRIPVKMNNTLISLDSYIGGYNILFPKSGKRLDFSNFRKGKDFSNGINIYYAVFTEEKEEINYDLILNTMDKRLGDMGVKDYSFSIDNDNKYIIGTFIDSSDVIQKALVSVQRGNLKFKILPNNLDWTEETYQDYFYDPTVWVDTEMGSKDLLGVEVYKETGSKAGTISMLLRFSDEGRQSFNELARQNISRPIAMYLDDSEAPLAVPIVSEDLANGLVGDPVVRGTFDPVFADYVKSVLNNGTIPYDVKAIDSQTVYNAPSSNTLIFLLLSLGVFFTSLLIFYIVYYKYIGLLGYINIFLFLLASLSFMKIYPITISWLSIFGISFITIINIFITTYIIQIIKSEKRKNIPNELIVNNLSKKRKDILYSMGLIVLLSLVLMQFLPNMYFETLVTIIFGSLTCVSCVIFVFPVFLELFFVGGYE